MKKTLALMALTILTACDYAAKRDLREERDNRLYREAMDDYRAGRMDAALAGFEKSIQKDPSNASARFQHACLLQDVKGDYRGAFCGYYEYLLQHPESDKARLAKDRLATCEKELAKSLATKYGLNSAGDAAVALNSLRAELKASEERFAASEKNLGDALARVRSLIAERDRLLKIVKGGVDESQDGTKAMAVEAKDLLEEGNDELAVSAPRNEERMDLLAEESAEAESGSSLLPARKPEDLVPKKVVKDEKPKEQVPDHPKTYVVQEGDTLYGVAKRFYGRSSAWKSIREANKALISADNRLKAGDTITLP